MIKAKKVLGVFRCFPTPAKGERWIMIQDINVAMPRRKEGFWKDKFFQAGENAADEKTIAAKFSLFFAIRRRVYLQSLLLLVSIPSAASA